MTTAPVFAPTESSHKASNHTASTQHTPNNISTRSSTTDAPFLASSSGLKLSRNVISSVFRLPFEATLDPNSELGWNLHRRTGPSSLYGSLSYLSSPSTQWNHTVVGWTGEIRTVSHETSDQPKDSIPRNPSLPSLPPDNIVLPASRRRDLTDRLRAEYKGNIVPVWLATDPINDELVYINQNDDKKLALRNQVRWTKYCQEELYPVLHYRHPQGSSQKSTRQHWADYVKVNKAFASKILEIYQPGDIVIIHNYELMLVPTILRQRLPKSFIGFYLHAPFPSSEFYRCLPRRKEILEGMLGSNMIGFQSYGYSRHFSSCCTRILGYQSSSAGVDARGSHVAADIFPAAVNSDEILNWAFTDSVTAETDAFRNMYRGKKIVVGRDRLDESSGVVQKLEAFEVFLDQYPEWQNKCVLIQITGLQHDTNYAISDENKKYLTAVTTLVERINKRFGSTEYKPVVHYPKYVSQTTYFALLRAADVCLASSVRDGMNTTALEYVLCQKNSHNPLLLSEFSGTAGALATAIHINPWDFSGVADSIARALNLEPKTKVIQHEKLFSHVKSNNVQVWTEKYLKRLMTNLSSFDQSIVTPVLDRNRLLSQYKKAKHRLFLFDYDGTLTPIVQDPQSAIPSDKVIRTIKTLASDPNNTVWIISGRDQEFLDEWMGHIYQLGFSAEHGSFLRYPNQEEWLNLASQIDMGWQEKVEQVFNRYTERTQGSFLERKKIALTWHYRRSDPEHGAFQAKACRSELEATVASLWDVEVMSGKANVEVRPKFLNKGEIVRRLIEEYSQNGKTPDLVFCVGDDFTDEDMFRSLLISSLPRDYIFTSTVGAGSKQTKAMYHLNDPSDVIATIALLNQSAGR